MFVPPSPVTSALGCSDSSTTRRCSGVVATLQGTPDKETVVAAVVPKALKILAGDGMEKEIGLTTVKQVLDGKDWRQKFRVLRQLDEVLKGGTPATAEPGELVPLMESMAKLFRDLKDTKPEIQGASRVTQLAMGVVGGLAKANAAGGRFCVSAAAIIPELLPFLSTSKEAVQESVTASVEMMLTYCHSPGVLRAATAILVNSKKAHLRRKGSGFLCVAIERWPAAALRTTLPPIMNQMRKALFDADATVRREGRHTFGVFVKLWPAEGGGMYHALDRVHQRAILQEQPHVSNFVGGKTGEVPTTESSSSSTGSGSGSGTSTGGAGATTMPPPPACVGGGGGQRPAGVTVTQAQQRNLLRWKMNKEKEREKQQQREALTLQQRRATAALGDPMLTPKSPTKCYSYPLAVAVATASAAAAENTADAAGESRIRMTSGIQSPRAGLLSHRRSGSGSVLASPPRSAPESADSQVSNVLCSERLKHAAKLALRKHELLSPTMKSLLQEEANKLPACVGAAAGAAVAGDLGRPGGDKSSGFIPHAVTKKFFSEETPVKERDTAAGLKEALNRASPLMSPCSQGLQESRDGRSNSVDCGIPLTPAELRGSMAGEDKVTSDDAVGAMVEAGEGDVALDLPLTFRGDGLDGDEEGDNVVQPRSCCSSSSIGYGDNPECRGVEADGLGGDPGDLPTRVLFTDDDDGEEGDGNGSDHLEGEENREGGGSNLGDTNPNKTTGPLSTRSSSSLPRISSLASSFSSSSIESIPSPSQEDAGRRAPASSVVRSVSDTIKHYNNHSAKAVLRDNLPSTTTTMLMSLGDGDQMPKLQGILTSSGTGNAGGNMIARQQVRCSEAMDHYSVAGSLNSPCNLDNMGGRSPPRGFSAAAVSTTESGGEKTLHQRLPWWRSALRNVFLVASTLCTFAVLSTFVSHVGLSDHGVGKMLPDMTLPPLPSPALPLPLEKFMPASVLRWFIDDGKNVKDNFTPRAWSLAVDLVAAAARGDSSSPVEDEARVASVGKDEVDQPVVVVAAAESVVAERATSCKSSVIAQSLKHNAAADTMTGVTKVKQKAEEAIATAQGLSRGDTEEIVIDDVEQVMVASAAETDPPVATTTAAAASTTAASTAAASTAITPSDHNKRAEVGAVEGSCVSTTVITRETPAGVTQAGSRDEADRHPETGITDAAVVSVPAEPAEAAATAAQVDLEVETAAVEFVPGPSGSSGDDVIMGVVAESITVTTTTTTPSRSYHRLRELPQSQQQHHPAHETSLSRKEGGSEVETAAPPSSTSASFSAYASDKSGSRTEKEHDSPSSFNTGNTASGLRTETKSDLSSSTTSGVAASGFKTETKSDSSSSTTTGAAASGLRTETKSDSSSSTTTGSAASGLRTETKSDLFSSTTSGVAASGLKAETKSDSSSSTTTGAAASGLRTKTKSESSFSTTKEQDGGRVGFDVGSTTTTGTETTVRMTTATTTTTPTEPFHRRWESPPQVHWRRTTMAENSSRHQRRAAVTVAASASGWGWVEVSFAMAGAIALLVAAVSTASNNHGGERSDRFSSELGARRTGDYELSTPERDGDRQAWSELGTYTTVEMVKRGSSPATLRSVKRSRRISSAHKTPRAAMVVMDLGATATALDLN